MNLTNKGFEVLTTDVTIYWYITLCRPGVKQHFRGTHHLRHHSQKSAKAIYSSEMSVHMWAAQRYIPTEGSILSLAKFELLSQNLHGRTEDNHRNLSPDR